MIALLKQINQSDVACELQQLGLHLIDKSPCGNVTYWSVDAVRRNNQPLLRLSWHRHLFTREGCKVTLGNCPDDDVRLYLGETAEDAVALLLEAQIEYNRDLITGGYTCRENPDGHAIADAEEALFRKKWSHVLG